MITRIGFYTITNYDRTAMMIAIEKQAEQLGRIAAMTTINSGTNMEAVVVAFEQE
ncbi:MAG: hypothetical protein WC517_04120 [Patescibacteria group bacterium]